MITKNHDHTLQTNQHLCEEEQQNANSHSSPRRQPSIFLVKVISKLERTVSNA